MVHSPGMDGGKPATGVDHLHHHRGVSPGLPLQSWGLPALGPGIPLSWPWTILPAVVNQGWVLGLAMPLGGLLLWVSSHSGARLAYCVVCIGVGLQCKILQFKKITIINSLEGGAYCN